ncbi:MAG: hypothetical protein RLY20_2741 [Verrucomicrobiota bacterium]|jgi:tetratricopeptide (TPR) repeat protein
MSTDTKTTTKGAPTASPTAAAKSPPAVPKTPALFRPIDWFCLLVVTTIVMVGYYLTIAPDLTLEDSGELATASFYAGIPHPPGYPVWTLYTYLWANYLPFNNIAWRVAIGEAFAGAFACGLIGLIVSRGSSLMIEGIEVLKNIDRKWENAICVISGYVAGTLLGFNGYMWSQSVIVEVYSFSVVSLMIVLALLLRWIYTPKKWRYLAWAFFIFGICFTNHQTLIVAAMGIVVAIAAVDYKMGRNMFLWCAIAYTGGVVLWAQEMIFRDTNPMVFAIFNLVGVTFLATYILFAVLTRITFLELCRDTALMGLVIFACAIPGMGKSGLGNLCAVLALAAFALVVWLGWETRKDGLEWLFVLACGLLWLFGAGFNLYMPLSGMSTPPMQWGYPRTLEGFIHALTRGQYEKTNPTNFFTVNGWTTFVKQLVMVGHGIIDEFNWVYTLIALVPFLFLPRMQKRERSWMIGLVAIYLCLSVLLIVLLNPGFDKQQRELTRVFFTASHVMIVMWIGYGLTMIAASLLVRYKEFRPLGLIGCGVGGAFAVYSLYATALEMNEGLQGASVFSALGRAFQSNQYGMPIIAGLLLIGLVAVFLVMLLLGREKPHLGVALVLFTVMPLHSVISHWADNEQRNHLFGYWFGHDMFTPPFRDTDGKLSYDPKRRAELMKDPVKGKYVYPEMTRDAILYGGTDPGRFCPTYMIFCESFIPPSCKPRDPNFDRRDVYIITQNALADGTYLMYIRSHYNKSAQIQYDKPFFKECVQTLMVRDPKEREYVTHPLAKTAYEWLDKPFIDLGNSIEKRRRAEGVYPKNEMYIATPEDSQRCFQEYMADAQRRMQIGQLRPGEDVRVVKDANGIDRVQVSGQVAVMAINGLLTKVMFDHNPTNEFFVEESFPLEWMYPHLTPFGVIMKINRQPTKSLPVEVLEQDHQFWSDYSERLIGNWITYNTSVKEIVDFVEKTYLRKDFNGFKGDLKFVRDDQGQKAFSKLRSSIAGIYAWRLGMNGMPVIPDEQKPYVARPGTKEYNDLLKEADFSFKQAFAFCPYSPEAVFRYMQVLIATRRFDDAILVVETAQKLDPNNTQLGDTVKRLKSFRESAPKVDENISKLKAQWKANPGDFQAAVNLVSLYRQLGQTEQCIEVLDEVLKSPKLNADAILAVANFYAVERIPNKLEEVRPHLYSILDSPNASPDLVNMIIQVFMTMQDFPGLEKSLERLSVIKSDSAEAFYDLASIKVMNGKVPEGMVALKKSLVLSDARAKTNPAAPNIRSALATDPRYKQLAQTPEFKALVSNP